MVMQAVKNRVQQLFPRRVNSLDEFISIAKRERAISVTAELSVSSIGTFTGSGIPSFISAWTYAVKYKAKIPSGRPYEFVKPYGYESLLERYSEEAGSTNEPSNLDAICLADTKMILVEIGQEIPGIATRRKYFPGDNGD